MTTPSTAEHWTDDDFTVPVTPAGAPLFDARGALFLPLTSEIRWLPRILADTLVGYLRKDRVISKLVIHDYGIEVTSHYLPTAQRGIVAGEEYIFPFGHYTIGNEQPLLKITGDRYQWTTPLMIQRLVGDVNTHLACVHA